MGSQPLGSQSQGWLFALRYPLDASGANKPRKHPAESDLFKVPPGPSLLCRPSDLLPLSLSSLAPETLFYTSVSAPLGLKGEDVSFSQ